MSFHVLSSCHQHFLIKQILTSQRPLPTCANRQWLPWGQLPRCHFLQTEGASWLYKTCSSKDRWEQGRSPMARMRARCCSGNWLTASASLPRAARAAPPESSELAKASKDQTSSRSWPGRSGGVTPAARGAWRATRLVGWLPSNPSTASSSSSAAKVAPSGMPQ